MHSNKWQARSDWWSIFSYGVVSWLIQVLTSATSDEQALGAETIFLVKMWWVLDLTSSEANKYRGTNVLYSLCCTNCPLLAIGKFFQLASAFFLSSPENMLIDFRERGWEIKRERNIDMREKCSHPDWEPNMQPRHVPWPEIEATNF